MKKMKVLKRGYQPFFQLRYFQKMLHGTNTTKVFTEVFVELSLLEIAITDKTELCLTASQVSPGTILVQSIIIKKCLHRE